MKRILVLFLVCMVALSGCSNTVAGNQDFAWSEEDFSFYEEDGREKVFPTVDDYQIALSYYDNLQTNRGIRIGDRATLIADLYDLTDFEWSIGSLSYPNPFPEKSDALEEKYRADNLDAADILNNLPEISANEMAVYLSCDVYKCDGVLSTISGLDVSKSESDPFYDYYDEPEKTEQFVMNHLKYTIMFIIDGEVVSDVSIESNYHNYLNVAYSVSGELIDRYSWIKDME